MSIPESRRIYCNRTLNLRAIKAIGYDMDYTLIHYHVEKWERRAYEHLKSKLLLLGWPVGPLEFDPDLICRGLIIDAELGNIVKSNRFGFIKKAMHGLTPISFDALRGAYSRTIVDLSEPRWVFLNTLFSLSEGCMYAQLVDLLDRRLLPQGIGYADLYRHVKDTLSHAHMDGKLKSEVIAAPDTFVDLDAEAPLALLDQKNSGKKLLLITNSEWSYAAPMMHYAFDRYLPKGTSWRDLFDVVIIGASKPDFFTSKNALFEIVTADGLLSPSTNGLRNGAAFFGGNARHVEEHLGLAGDEILYVGDHMFGDVKVTKDVLRWRTALVVRELEAEIDATTSFRALESKLSAEMDRKEVLEQEFCELKLMLQRKQIGYADGGKSSEEKLQQRLNTCRSEIAKLDQEISPLAQTAGELGSPRWGPLMRTGNDKSHLAFQLERYADIYTSRVSNFMYTTPFAYLRSPRGSLPHDL